LRTLFAVNIALKQLSYTERKSSKQPENANDGALDTCFTSLEEDELWYLELGTSVHVSMVFMVAYSIYDLYIYVTDSESFQRFPISSVYYSLVLLLS